MNNLAVACICMQITEEEIIVALKSGATTLEEIRKITGANTGCRRCENSIRNVIGQYLENLPVGEK